MKTRLLSLALVAGFLLAPAALAQEVQDLYVGDGAVHYSLRANQVVPDSMVTDDNWDLLIDGTDIKPNGTGLLVAQAYDRVSEVPAEGLKDGVMRTAEGGRWYNYDQDSHFVWPVPDHTFVVSLPGDTHAKFEIYSYYNLATEDPRYLSFRYELAPEGSRDF